MRTRVTKRAQTSVPSSIRKRYGIGEGDMLEWVDDGQVIRIIPLPADPIRALRGRARGEDLVQRLLTAREEDAQLDSLPSS
jgi:AbrB family looped-hinge helix DNA binding protein